MARMHAHKKGKAGSTKPVRFSSPSWVRYSPEEVVKIITKLSKEGHGGSVIGVILRDQYGIPSVKLLTGKSISKILEENSLLPEYPEDFFKLLKHAVKVRKHLENSPRDGHSERGLRNLEAKILRLAKYYKQTGKLSSDWKYDPEAVAIIVSGR